MNTVSVLLGVLLIAASALCAVAIWALVKLVDAARSVTALADDTRSRLIPLLDKTDVTVDAANAELLRIDLLLIQFEEASDRFSQASETVSGIANAPERIVEDITGRVRSWVGKRQDRSVERQAEREARAESPAASTAPGGAEERTDGPQ